MDADGRRFLFQARMARIFLPKEIFNRSLSRRSKRRRKNAAAVALKQRFGAPWRTQRILFLLRCLCSFAANRFRVYRVGKAASWPPHSKTLREVAACLQPQLLSVRATQPEGCGYGIRALLESRGYFFAPFERR
jgi:hypothetical protein